MRYKEAKEILKNHHMHPSAVLYGAEKYLEMEKKARILERAVDKIRNYDHLSGAECRCYAGDNGYCCGVYIAEKALKEYRKVK